MEQHSRMEKERSNNKVQTKIDYSLRVVYFCIQILIIIDVYSIIVIKYKLC